MECCLDGKSIENYDINQFYFSRLLLDELNRVSVSEYDIKISSLEDIHLLPDINYNVEKYRQILFSFFRTETFQEMYRSFGAYILEKYFDEKALIQKVPTVRIQVPQTTTTSYHTDAWYGHGQAVKSFWIPMVQVSIGNTLHIATSKKKSRECLEKIIATKASLKKINSISREICEPFKGVVGDMLIFSSDMIHGVEKNIKKTSRVSFDFRVAPDPSDLGTKPKSNFYSFNELIGFSIEEREKKKKSKHKRKALSYSNNCSGKSAQAQLMLCSTFAESRNIDIIKNESEIYIFDHMPVMISYLLDKDEAINTVITFGLDVFDSNKELARTILQYADEGGKSIIFCAEGLEYLPETKHDDILSKL